MDNNFNPFATVPPPTTVDPSTPQKSTQEIVAAITNANGLMPLAAERLGMSVDSIIIALAVDPRSMEMLSSYFRVKMLLNTFMNLHIFTQSVMTFIGQGDYANDIKAMSAFSTLFVELTRAQANMPLNVNVFERTMAILPKPVRDSVMAIVDPNTMQLHTPAPKGKPRLARVGADDDDDDD